MYYYAHLDRYAEDLSVGDEVKRGSRNRLCWKHGQRADHAAASALRRLHGVRCDKPSPDFGQWRTDMDRRSLFMTLFAPPVVAYIGRPPAPDFRGKTLSGESFSRDALKDRPVLIQFWATWCGYCRRDEPAVERIVREQPDLIVLAVNVNESKQKIRAYLERSPRTPKIVATEDTNLPAVFEVKAFPTYVLIDKKSALVDRQDGAGGYAALQHLLGKL